MAALPPNFEQQLWPILLWLVPNLFYIGLIFVFVSICYQRRKRRMSILKMAGIDGPEPNLISGNMAEYYSMANVEWDNYLTQRYGKITGYYLGAKPFVLISDMKLVQAIEHSSSFLERPRRIPGGINPDRKRALMLGNLPVHEWQIMRKILSPVFNTTNLKKMVSKICPVIDCFIDKVDKAANAHEQFDFYEAFQSLTLDIIGTIGFGIEMHVQQDQSCPLTKSSLLKAVCAEFAKTTNHWLIKLYLCFPEISWILQRVRVGIQKIKCALFRMEESSALWELAWEALESRRHVNVTQCRNTTSSVDLFDVLLKSKTILSTDQIVANSVLFYEASYETLSASLGFIVHLLINHQNIQDKVTNELKEFFDEHRTLDLYEVKSQLPYLESVIKEGLRKFPTQTTFIGRSAKTDFHFTTDSGTNIILPKGVHIQIGLTQLHYSEELWPNPNEFNPDRFLSNEQMVAWQAFGAGRRNCVGERFAMLVLKLILSKLLHSFNLIPSDKTEIEAAITYKVATMTPTNGSWGLPIKNH